MAAVTADQVIVVPTVGLILVLASKGAKPAAIQPGIGVIVTTADPSVPQQPSADCDLA